MNGSHITIFDPSYMVSANGLIRIEMSSQAQDQEAPYVDSTSLNRADLTVSPQRVVPQTFTRDPATGVLVGTYQAIVDNSGFNQTSTNNSFYLTPSSSVTSCDDGDLIPQKPCSGAQVCVDGGFCTLSSGTVYGHIIEHNPRKLWLGATPAAHLMAANDETRPYTARELICATGRRRSSICRCLPTT